MTANPQKDIVTPTMKTYPKPEKPRKTYRTGWITNRGTEVLIVPPKGGTRRNRGATKYTTGFIWKPDPMVCIMLDVLCSEWECSRHECMRRLITPYVPLVRDAMEQEQDWFRVKKEFSLQPSDWPAWRKR
jgi:hypothetical protein